MTSLREQWLRPRRARDQFPPYELGDPSIIGMTQARKPSISAFRNLSMSSLESTGCSSFS